MGTGISRRAFFRRAAKAAAVVAAAATGVIDPEELLWTPKKTIFTPPAGGWPTGVIGVDYGHLDSYSMLHVSHPDGLDYGPFDPKAIEAAAKALADRIDQDLLRMYMHPMVPFSPPHKIVMIPPHDLDIRLSRVMDEERGRWATRLDCLFGMPKLDPLKCAIIQDVKA